MALTIDFDLCRIAVRFLEAASLFKDLGPRRTQLLAYVFGTQPRTATIPNAIYILRSTSFIGPFQSQAAKNIDA